MSKFAYLVIQYLRIGDTMIVLGQPLHSGVHWRALACSSVHWRGLACTGVLWRALACSGVQWRALACIGVLWC